MNYLELLRPEAENALRPLSAEAARRAKYLVLLESRAAEENERVADLESELAKHTARSGDALTTGKDSHDRWLVNHRRLTAHLEAAREAVRLFAVELVPNARRDREVAREALQRAASEFYLAVRAKCEIKMSLLLAQAVEERDGFLAACTALGKDYDTPLVGEPPRAAHVRLDAIRRHLTRPHELTFSNQTPEQRAAAVAALTPPAAAPAPPWDGSTPMVQIFEAHDAPGATPTIAPDAPDAEKCVTDTPQDAQDAAGIASTAPPCDAEGVTRPEPRAGEPAPQNDALDVAPDLEEQDAAAVDAEEDTKSEEKSTA